MTEITAKSYILFPKTAAPTQLMDPVAFALAIVGGPLVVATIGAPLFAIPVMAVVFGGPLYLLIGIPVLLVDMRRNPVTSGRWARLAFASFILLGLPMLFFTALIDKSLSVPGFFLIFGSVFAPLWGAVIGYIYGRLERDFYKQTI
ncbi:hypothetical protein [Pseudophaeobacter sp.]|uniref:hypothetical protein n=1 Tax=Pseudophaeobacter sp. TaxID=1971739 RepID=UPI004058B4AA